MENKENLKLITDVSKSTEYTKKSIYNIKKEQIMVDANESKKAEALW